MAISPTSAFLSCTNDLFIFTLSRSQRSSSCELKVNRYVHKNRLGGRKKSLRSNPTDEATMNCGNCVSNQTNSDPSNDQCNGKQSLRQRTPKTAYVSGKLRSEGAFTTQALRSGSLGGAVRWARAGSTSDLDEHDEDGRKTVGLELLAELVEVKERWLLGLDAGGDAGNVLLARDAAAARGAARLQVKQILPQRLGGCGQIVDLGVRMQAENLGRLALDAGHRLDGLDVDVAVAALGDRVVYLRVLVKVEGLEGVEEEVA
eukprot:3218320-Pleurochrysis_carterae.AAC.1